MIWARRIVAPGEWNEVQDQFESLFVKLGCPGQMMLVATSGPGVAMLYASLPNTVLLTALAGFEQTGDGELPAEASLLVGHPPHSGGLFTYGPRLSESFKRLAYYVARILRGAKPSDLPVESPTRFELVVNLKTAHQIGIKLPASLIALADEIIE
jgi:hypothetical protein